MNAEEWNKKEDLLQEQGNYRIIVLDHRPLAYQIAQTYIIQSQAIRIIIIKPGIVSIFLIFSGSSFEKICDVVRRFYD